MFNLMPFSPSSELEYSSKIHSYVIFSDFGRYASQTEHSMDDVIETTDQIPTQQKSPNNIPPLMSLTITPPPPPPIMTTSVQSTSPLSTSVIKEK